MSRYSSDNDAGIKIFLLLVFCAGLFVFYLAKAGNTATVTATVSEKVVKRSGQTDQYLIMTDKETFNIKDSWLKGQVSSSDLYARIKPDKTYKLKVFGWRIPFFSSYRTIYEAEEL